MNNKIKDATYEEATNGAKNEVLFAPRKVGSWIIEEDRGGISEGKIKDFLLVIHRNDRIRRGEGGPILAPPARQRTGRRAAEPRDRR